MLQKRVTNWEEFLKVAVSGLGTRPTVCSVSGVGVLLALIELKII